MRSRAEGAWEEGEGRAQRRGRAPTGRNIGVP